MRKALFIFAGVLLLAVLGAMLARQTAAASTPPDVKVTFLGLTNSSAGSNVATSSITFFVPTKYKNVPVPTIQYARFQVLNRGGRRIRVFHVGIQGCQPYDSLFLGQAILGKPITVEPGASGEFLSSFLPGAPRWRGVVGVRWDTPGQRFRDWLLGQTWRRYLPRKVVPAQGVTYTYGSQWEDKLPGQPHGARPATPTPVDLRSKWRAVADAVY